MAAALETARQDQHRNPMPTSPPFLRTLGDTSWEISIDATQSGYQVLASSSLGERCSLHIDAATADELAKPTTTSDENLSQLIAKHVQLTPQPDGSVQLVLRPPAKASDDVIPSIAPTPGAAQLAAEGTTARPHTAGPLPVLQGDTKKRLSTPPANSTLSLPSIDTSPTTAPPMKSLSRSPSIRGVAPPAATSSNWIKLIKVMRRVPIFDLEEAVLRNTYDVKLRVELGLRYSEEMATEVPAMILLEQASFFNDNAAVGSLYSLLSRYPRYHYCFAFHLQKCTSSFAKALSFIENVADSSLIVKYATGLFMKGERELPYELLKSLSLTYGSNGSKLEPAAVVDRHALLFRVTLANSIMHEAVLHMTKLIQLVTADPALVPKGYVLNDFHLMLARCAQIEGDFLFATSTFSRILGETFGHSTVYSDDQFFSLWFNLGTTCYDQGHMWLCIEYYTLALTYAKHLPMRATIYYRRGMAFFCIGEPIKAEDDYRRAKSACHDVKPDVTLHELKKDYLVEFDKLLDTPVEAVIGQVRRGMGKTTASIKVQRHFRHFMQRKRKKSDASRFMRRFSNSSKMPSNVHLLPTTREANEAATAAASPGPPAPLPELSPADLFKNQRAAALQSLQALHANCMHVAPLGKSPKKSPKKTQPQLQSISSFLTPDFDRPEARRHRSITSYRRLGYSTGDVSCVQHWKAIIKCGQMLYPDVGAIHRAIAHVKFFHTHVPEDVAFCALSDSDGQVDEACGKLSDADYRSELDCICRVVDVSAWMHDDGRTVELAGVPEIDPDTGKFFVHALHTAMFRHAAAAPSPTKSINGIVDSLVTSINAIDSSPPKPKQSSLYFEKRVVKDKSFRVGHVIERHASTSDLAMPDSILVEPTNPRPPKLLQAISSTRKLR